MLDISRRNFFKTFIASRRIIFLNLHILSLCEGHICVPNKLSNMRKQCYNKLYSLLRNIGQRYFAI